MDNFHAALARGREARRAVENCMCLDDEGLSMSACSCSTWAAEALGDILDAAPRWIPCSERMPEAGAEALIVSAPTPDCFAAVYLSRRYHPKERLWECDGIDFEADEVSHWMPLPELP